MVKILLCHDFCPDDIFDWTSNSRIVKINKDLLMTEKDEGCENVIDSDNEYDIYCHR